MTERFLPDEPFPPYSYVPGKFPHPIRDPDGHSYGQAESSVPRPQSAAWRECNVYLRGLDLFNAGFYWEAHEVWEQLWHACGRTGRDADFFKGLIKLAAAGVKAKEGNAAGVTRHAIRASELLRSVEREGSDDADSPGRHFGLCLAEAIELAEQIVQGKRQIGDGEAIVLSPID